MAVRIYFGTQLSNEQCQDAPHAASFTTPWASEETPLVISSYAVVRCQTWDPEKGDYTNEEPREVILLEGGSLLPESLVITNVREVTAEGVTHSLMREGTFNNAYRKLASQYSMWSINHISVADYAQLFNKLFAGLRIHSAYRKTYRKSLAQKEAWHLMELDFCEGDEAIFEQRWAEHEASKQIAEETVEAKPTKRTSTKRTSTKRTSTKA